MSERLEELKRYLTNITSANQLADRIAELFGCPITIEDANHHVISYSKHKDDIDQVRISTIMNRKVPDKVINAFWKKGVMPKLIDHDDPVVIPEIKEVGLGNRVAISIRQNTEILGFIWAHPSNKAFTEEDMLLFKEAAGFVKKFFIRNLQRERKSEESYSDFFWQLLRGDIKSDDAITRQANQFNMQLDGDKAIVVIRFSDDITEQMEKHANYLSESQVKVHVLISLFDEHDFIMLIRFKDEVDSKQALYDFMKQFIHRISKQLKLNDVRSGAGLAYRSARHIEKSYQQALEVLKLQGKFPDQLNDVSLFEDLGVYQFIEMLAETRKHIHYENQHLVRLRAYDRKHHTSLLATLHVYLQCDSNVYNAAHQLFIHPNTMNYRLKRIREVSGIDLKDPNQKTNMYLDLIIDTIQDT